MSLSNAIPSGPEIDSALGSGYANIQALAAAANERLAVEHYSTIQPASPTSHEALHKAGSAIAFFSYDAPLTRLGGVAFDNDYDRGLLWLRPMPSTWQTTGIEYIDVYTLKDADGLTFDEKWHHLSKFSTLNVDTIEEQTADAGVTISGTKFDRDVDSNATVVTDEVLANDSVTVGAVANPTLIEPTRVRTQRISLVIGRPAAPANGDIWIQ